MFHDTQAEFGDRGDGYVSRTIALANCCPPLRYKLNHGDRIYLNTGGKVAVNNLNVLLASCSNLQDLCGALLAV